MTEHKPAIPVRVRDAIYFVGLGFGFTSIIAAGVVPLAAPEHTAATLAVLGATNSAMLFLTSATGVAYRPGINPTVADGTAVTVTPDADTQGYRDGIAPDADGQ